ncbi:MAG TPA: hypothetical protein VHO94_03045 [Oscillospiraceae bacterium]|nr:hypothetical protein [Oscillospiraceae bacterium]
MSEFFTWQLLSTFAGCTLATGILTQFVKNVPFLKKIATQWVSYAIAVILLFAATFFTGALTGSSAAMIPFNAVLIALSSNGAYSAVKRVSTGKQDS